MVTPNTVRADHVLDLHSWPGWVFWVFAAVGACGFALVLFRMMPPHLRRSQGGASVGLGLAVYFVAVGLSGSPREALWIGAFGFTASSLPLLWMGRIPADMPSARNPAVYQHPQYAEVARKGRFAGIGIVVLVLAVIILTAIFVRF